MSELKYITTLGKVNQAKLRNYFNFKTINEAIKTLLKDVYDKDLSKVKKFNEKAKATAYKILQQQYNEIVEADQAVKEMKMKQEKIKLKNTYKFVFQFSIAVW